MLLKSSAVVTYPGSRVANLGCWRLATRGGEGFEDGAGRAGEAVAGHGYGVDGGRRDCGETVAQEGAEGVAH